MKDVKNVKIVIVGDQKTGKTCMVLGHVGNSKACNMDYEPTIYDGYSYHLHNAPVDDLINVKARERAKSASPRSVHRRGGSVWLSRKRKPSLPTTSLRVLVSDTGGAAQYHNIRRLSYRFADVILITFSVMNPSSFLNVQHVWNKEVKRFAPEAAIILVGTKIDARDNPGIMGELKSKKTKIVSSDEGEDLACSLGFCRYVECSAVTGEGIDQVFRLAGICGVEEPKETCNLGGSRHSHGSEGKRSIGRVLRKASTNSLFSRQVHGSSITSETHQKLKSTTSSWLLGLISFKSKEKKKIIPKKKKMKKAKKQKKKPKAHNNFWFACCSIEEEPEYLMPDHTSMSRLSKKIRTWTS
mmetsp:Transcript_8695/g.12972  ORF Transcript_8695/g.12972 Transcript_8695/m.12972 type:complete len:355 (+) Transcript_8695:131-1195(+)